MGGVSRARFVGSILGAALLLATAPAASAFDFLDGRVQVHGFYESQIRSMARDYRKSDGWDLTQWYHVINIEVDWEIAPDGFGPFDLVSAFGRVEARYDCVWTKSCGAFPSVNTYGQRGRNGRQPDRLSDGKRRGNTFQSFTNDQRHYYDIPVQGLSRPFIDPGSAKPMPLFDLPGFTGLFGIAGLDGVLGTADDPANFYFSSLLDECRFNVRKIGGTQQNSGVQVLPHTVNKSDCGIRPEGSLRNKPNPFRAPIDFAGRSAGLMVPNNTNPPGSTSTTLDGAIVQVPAGDFIPPLFPAPGQPDSDPNDPLSYPPSMLPGLGASGAVLLALALVLTSRLRAAA